MLQRAHHLFTLIAAALVLVPILLIAEPEKVFLGPDGKYYCNSLFVVQKRFEVDVNVSEIANKCQIAVGHVRYVRFFDPDPSDYEPYIFHELEEITDWLLVNRLENLVSLRTIFPKLKVIWGMTLFMDYSLVISDLPQLTEIGLSNLIRINRGSVIVHSCPNLCYVDTVNWMELGANGIVHYDKNKNLQCYQCSKECHHGHCWNATTCQNFDRDTKCHDECYGCSKPNSATHCEVCKHFENTEPNGVVSCVSECPEDKLYHNASQRCVPESYCVGATDLNSSIVYDTRSCVKECPYDYEEIDDERNKCKYCGEHCVVNCPGDVINSEAFIDSFRHCTNIQGSLIIENMNRHTHVEGLKVSLSKVRSISGFLRISRSPAIRDLSFLRSLTNISGEQLEWDLAIRIFENDNLQSLAHLKNLTIYNGNIYIHHNAMLCSKEIDELLYNQITFPDIPDKVNYKDRVNAYRDFNGLNAICPQTNVSFETILDEDSPKSVKIKWKSDSNELWYTILYVATAEGQVVTSHNYSNYCAPSKWMSQDVFNSTSVQLNNLTPYTRYAFYMKIYGSNASESLTSFIDYFKTLPDDPSEPLDFEAVATSDSVITLTWNPPKYPNGHLEWYNITVLIEPDQLDFINERDYCYHPHVEEPQPASPVVTTEVTDDMNCTCKPKPDDQLKIFLTNRVQICHNETETGECDDTKYQFEETVRRKREGFEDDYKLISVPANVTSFNVTGLKHYTLYIFFMQACNRKELPREQCSPVTMGAARTKQSPLVDSIENVYVNVKGKHVDVEWNRPRTSNSFIVGYLVEYKRIDSEHSNAVPECLSDTETNYPIQELSPGKYSVRVQAISLAGRGKFSQFEYFEITATDTPPWLIALLTVLSAVFVSGVTFALYRWYRKKHHVDNIYLITNINPDYAGANYVPDEWELDRSDVEIANELGKGSFGLVYQGYIKSKKLSCAIKTLNPEMENQMEFLNEGSVMKGFNDAHHVIKLLGIVSKGQPLLVVMELMERGDLKNFLRSRRGPSQDLTSNEIYRMASEIADGMAYLSAKKFVHRDLAARNCMVGADYTVKIGDFGMARDIYETDYYRKKTMGLLPVRWMAPESLADGVFTSDSDVWSYGVVLWEIATLAEQPYQGLSNEEVFNFVKNRGKLGRPSECSENLYQVMKSCWRWRPNDRPTFSDIVFRLEKYVGPTFKLVAFCYSKHGQDHALNAGPRPFNPPAMSNVPESEHGDMYSHYDAEEEEVNLFGGTSHQRYGHQSYHSPTATASSYGSS